MVRCLRLPHWYGCPTPAIITAPVSNVATTVTTAGNLLSYDGNDQPTVTLYYDADENASTEIPKAFGNLKVWLDANDTANMDTGYAAGSSQPANNGQVGFWKDKSGNNNHAVAVSNSAGNRPTYWPMDLLERALPSTSMASTCPLPIVPAVLTHGTR